MKTLRLAPILGALAFVFALDAVNPRTAALAQEDRPSMTEELTLDLSATSPSNTVLDNARAIAELSMFVAAFERAGLAERLASGESYTLFAPVNAAFEGADLDMDDTERLRNVLLYHVTEGETAFGNLNDGMILVMMDGNEAAINTTEPDLLRLYIDDAEIVHPDIESSNGVIHLINLVLDPTPGGQADSR